MAGSYPNVPSRRFGLDSDGSVLVKFGPDTTSRAIIEASATHRDNITDEEGGVAFDAGGFTGLSHGGRIMYAWVFPELREIDGVFIARQDGLGLTALEHSANTTNGSGGTWVTEIADLTDHGTVRPTYRSSITSTAASSKRGLRCTYLFNGGLSGSAQGLQAFHVYGEIAPGQTPDRLLFIDEATGLEFTASYDYGDIPRGGSEDITWRFRNNSASLTATTIQYTAEDLYLGSGGWYTHTLPGGSTYQATRQVASLTPATTSGLITTRRVTPGNEDLGTHAGRIYLNVDTWV